MARISMVCAAILRSSGLLIALGLAACGDGTPPEADAGVGQDAPALDTGPGGPTVACGAATCDGTQYCRVTPNGPCVYGSTNCDGTQEICQSGGMSGCTPTRTRACAPLPTGCAGCACIIAGGLCPAGMGGDCRKPQNEGITLECPYN